MHNDDTFRPHSSKPQLRWTHQSRIPQSRSRIYIVAVDRSVPNSEKITESAGDLLSKMMGVAGDTGDCLPLDAFLLAEAPAGCDT